MIYKKIGLIYLIYNGSSHGHFFGGYKLSSTNTGSTNLPSYAIFNTCQSYYYF